MFIHKKLFYSVNTITIAKPEKGQQVEAAIIQMAQTGQLAGWYSFLNFWILISRKKKWIHTSILYFLGRLSEEELIGLLERFAGSTKKSTVKFDRRRNALDSDDDDDFWYISIIQNFPPFFSPTHTHTRSSPSLILHIIKENVLAKMQI